MISRRFSGRYSSLYDAQRDLEASAIWPRLDLPARSEDLERTHAIADK